MPPPPHPRLPKSPPSVRPCVGPLGCADPCAIHVAAHPPPGNPSGTFPNSFTALIELESLELFSNSLTGTLPSTLSTLNQLTTLWLFDNKFSGAIPSTFGVLSGLQTLCVELP